MPRESETAPPGKEAGEAIPGALSTPARSRGRWFRRATAGLVLLAAFVAGGWMYLGSEDALQRFYVPALRRSLNAEIEASGLNLQFPATLELGQFAFEHPDSQVHGRLEDLRVRIQPSSLLRGRTPRLMLLEARSIDLTLASGGGEEPERETEKGKTLERTTPWIPLSIDEANIPSIRLTFSEDDHVWLTAKLEALEVRDLHLDDNASLKTAFHFVFSPPASGRTFGSEGELTAHVRQPEAGRALAWEIDLPLVVREALDPAGASAPLEFSIIQRIEGAIRSSGEIELQGTATASRQGEPAGEVSASIEIGTRKDAGARRPMHIEARGAQLQPPLLNPLLAILGPEALADGSVEGRLRLDLDGESVEIDSEFRGDDLKLAANETHGETPALSIQLSQAAILHRGERRLKIERTSMDVRDRERLLIEARLTAPLEWFFEDDPDSAAEVSASGSAPGGRADSDEAALPARLEIELDRIDIDRLKPWTAVWGGDWLQPAAGGHLSAEIAAELEASARSINLLGRMTIEDFLWSRDASSSPVGPFLLGAEMTARSSDLSVISVEALSTQISSGDQLLMGIEGNGRMDRKIGSFDARMAASFPEIVSTLDRLDVTPESAAVELESGSGTFGLALSRTERDEVVRISGNAELTNLTLLAKRNRLVRSMSAEVGGMIPAGQSRIESVRLAMNVADAEGEPAGSMEVGGYWPTAYQETDASASLTNGGLGTSPVAGKLGIQLDGFDLKPWLELFGFRGDDPEGPPWPASSKLTLTVDPEGDVFTLEGEERIGPLDAGRVADVP